MKEPLTITTERVDDMPLLLGHMRQMGLAEQLDQHFPRHGNWQGLSLGQVIEVWLAHVLSQADHRMNQVQPWVEHRQQGLQQCTQAAVQASDVSDDRLSAILRYLSHDALWPAFEQALGRHGLLYVGDSKMGALQTRASLHAAGDYYLCPLSAVSMPADQLAQAIKTAQARAQPLQQVERWQADGTVEQIAHGYEQQVEVSAEVDGKTITWTERQLLVCSLAYRQSAQSRFQVRLQRAQHALP